MNDLITIDVKEKRKNFYSQKFDSNLEDAQIFLVNLHEKN